MIDLQTSNDSLRQLYLTICNSIEILLREYQKLTKYKV